MATGFFTGVGAFRAAALGLLAVTGFALASGAALRVALGVAGAFFGAAGAFFWAVAGFATLWAGAAFLRAGAAFGCGSGAGAGAGAGSGAGAGAGAASPKASSTDVLSPSGVPPIGMPVRLLRKISHRGLLVSA